MYDRWKCELTLACPTAPRLTRVFLVVFCHPTKKYTVPGYPEPGKERPLDVLVATLRKVRLTQLGHWMMGSTMIGRMRVGLSGSFGSDGLPCNFSSKDKEFLVTDAVKASYDGELTEKQIKAID